MTQNHAEQQQKSSTLRSAISDLIGAGFALCRILPGQKLPDGVAWQLNPIIDPNAWNDGDGVGVITGPLSNGLVTIDCDFSTHDTEAWDAADDILPYTACMDGRTGKLTAHRHYRVTDTVWDDHALPLSGATRDAMLAGTIPRFCGVRHFSNGNGRGVDFLAAGGQCVIPPSPHSSGQIRAWHNGTRGDPSAVSYAVLLAAVKTLSVRLGMRGRRDEAPLPPPDIESLSKIPAHYRASRLKAYLEQSETLQHGVGQGYHGQQYRMCCTACEFGVDIDTALPLLVAWDARSATPDGAHVILETLHRAYSRASFGSKIVGQEIVKNPLLNGSSSEQHGPISIETSIQQPSSNGRDSLRITYFKDTTERKPNWIWRGYLLRGATHVYGGKQGTSKGLCCVDIAARLTRGDPMPDGSGGGNPCKVLIVTREDDPEMALKPRLRVAGADMSMIAWTHGDFADGTPIPTMEEGVAAIEATVIAEKIDLVIIDPLGAWVEDDANNGQQIRAVIDPMTRLARKVGCAVVFVAHIRKAAAEDPMDAFAGSVQVTAACRIAVLISQTTDGTERIVEVAKTNFKRPDSTLMYKFFFTNAEPEDPPILVWRGANPNDQAAAVASKRGSAPIIAPDAVLEHLQTEHRPFDEVARSILKSLMPKIRGVTLQGVKDSLCDLIANDRAYEGRNGHKCRTIGRVLAPVIRNQTDMAIDYWLAHPQATVRQVADAVGCGVALAHKARRLALFTDSVHQLGAGVSEQ